MPKPEAIILDALKHARDECGCRILRGPLFDFCDYAGYPQDVRLKTIPDCNALGAVLIRHGAWQLCYPEFQAGWDHRLCEILGIEWGWIWRFSHGWNHGNVLTFEITDKNGKDRVIFDEISRDADRLARQWALPK